MNPSSNPPQHRPYFAGPMPPIPKEQQMMQQVMESCLFKTGISSVIGFGAGGLFGMFMSSMSWESSDEFLKMSTREQFRHTFRDMREKTYASAKNLAVVGAVYAGTECVIETYRAKNDIYNGVSAGCITGGALAARGGPYAIMVGCAGFAAFSAAIDHFMKES